MASDEFDYIICGAGASGLSLAWHLHQHGLTDKRILLVDRAPKTANDRTWCFWETGDNPFEPAVFRVWERVAFHGEGFSTVLDLAPYRYKMLRGIDFYRRMADWLAGQLNITQLYGAVTDVRTAGGAASVRVADREFRAEFAFNSIVFNPPAKTPAYHHLLQHFKGWVVRSAGPRFDPGVATLMDFRIEQGDDCRFCYVLPFDTHTALVEYTVFSPALLAQADYDRGLRDYVSNYLGLTGFDVLEEEFGIIPMGDAPYPPSHGERVINIGTAGGRTKPSTGYTFLRIQRHSRRIAQALASGNDPHVRAPLLERRYGLFDGVLLNVLETRRRAGRRVFTELFARNPVQRVFRFLDEDSTPAEDVAVMASTHLPSFIAATADVLMRRAAAR